MMKNLYCSPQREMVRAIQDQNYDAVKELLDEGFDVDSELMKFKNPIILCIRYNCLDIGKLLIKRGCSLSLKTIQGCTPLHIAVQLLNFDFVTLLLDNRADLTSINDEGKTVLHLAAELNSLKMVELLMTKATPEVLNIKDKHGKTPFTFACLHGNEALVSYFLNKGSLVNEQYGPFRNIPLLGAISSYNCTPEKITLLLDAGADINYCNERKETPLLYAFHIYGTKCYSRSHMIFHKVCHLLIDRGSDVNVNNTLGDTALHFAVIMNDELLVRKLLNAGCDVNAANYLGYTPIFFAVKQGYQTIATLLLNSGANIYQYNWSNETNKLSVVNYILMKSRECRSLRDSCRFVIRKNLHKSIDKTALFLPLPTSLIKFIQLVE